MDFEEETYVCAALIVGGAMMEKEERRGKKRKWCENWLLERNVKGSYKNLPPLYPHPAEQHLPLA